MSDYGDDEPEDAWDVGDPVPVLVENLARRLELVDVAPVRRYDIAAITLDYIAERVHTLVATRIVTGRTALRLEQLAVDVAYVEHRIEVRD